MISSYPVQMVELVRERWSAGGHDAGQLPDERCLNLLFDVIYQASLLREEGQTIRCRVLLQSPASFAPCFTCVVEGLQVLPFATPTAYTAHNIRKLAAAAGYQRSLLGVDFDQEGRPWIWGMVVTGAAWLNRIEGSRITGPAGFRRVLESQSGQLLIEGFDPFRSQWLPRQFEAVRARVLDQARQEVSVAAEDALADCFVKEVAQSVVRRALSLVRTRNHGGTLVYVPDDLGPRLDQWFRFRARLSPSPSTGRFGELLRQLTVRSAEIAEAKNLSQVRYQDLQQMNDSKFIRLDQALIEFSHLLADYMSVDGCLVLNHSFELLGFGAEILSDSHVSFIERALDLEGDLSVTEPADESGTRHRSAYRLVYGHKNVIAVVVSQDGGVRFVSHHGEKLTYWPYLP
jgi:hypothetical protein